jgi:hypothetical protein
MDMNEDLRTIRNNGENEIFNGDLMGILDGHKLYDCQLYTTAHAHEIQFDEGGGRR